MAAYVNSDAEQLVVELQVRHRGRRNFTFSDPDGFGLRCASLLD